MSEAKTTNGRGGAGSRAATSGGKADKRQLIMSAAEALFTSRRLHEITLDDVARDAHVGKGTIYRYFRDKDDLFFQTATQGFDQLCQLLQHRVPDNAPFAEQLLRACHEISGFFAGRRQLFQMMQTEEGRMSWCHGSIRRRWITHRGKLRLALATILQKGIDEAALRADIEAGVMAVLLLGMMRTRARELEDEPGEPPTVEAVVEVFLNGVSAGPAALGPAAMSAAATGKTLRRRAEAKPRSASSKRSRT